MKQQNKIFSIVFATVLALAIFTSALFVSANTSHHCHKEECPICEQVAICQTLLQSAMVMVAVVALFLLPVASYGSQTFFDFCFGADRTLVSLKVKLSN